MAFGDAAQKAFSKAGAREDREYKAQLQAWTDVMKKRALDIAALRTMQEQIRMQEQHEQRQLSAAVVAFGNRVKQSWDHVVTREEQEYMAQLRAHADATKSRATKLAAMEKTQEQLMMREQEDFSAVTKVLGDGFKKAGEYAHAVDERAARN